MGTQTLAIMFTDIKGFTSRTSEETREGLTHLLEEHKRLLLPVFRYFEGTVVKTIGDAFLVYFESPTDAVLCGVTIQEVLRRYNASVAEKQRLDVRVAINVGEVELQEKDVMGEAVNIASRLEGITEAGEVFFTDAVYQTMNRKEAPSAEVGERIFEGIPHPIRVYKVIDDPQSDLRYTLGRGVELSNTGPILRGLRKGPQRRAVSVGRLTGILGLLLLAVLAALVFLPSRTQRALDASSRLIAAGAHAEALDRLHTQIVADPGNDELVVLAVEAARGHMDALFGTGQFAEALEWLLLETSRKSYLSELLPQVAILDARATVAGISEDGQALDEYFPEALEELLMRYPGNPDVPYTAARVLPERASEITVLWLFGQALERGGYAGDIQIFDVCARSLSEGRIDYDRFRRAHTILRQSYPERRLSWAQETIDTGGVLAVRNAWQILGEESDPRMNDRYYRTQRALVDARPTDMEVAYDVFRQQTDPARRRHLIALHEEIVRTFPRFTPHGEKRDAISRTMERLIEYWDTP